MFQGLAYLHAPIDTILSYWFEASKYPFVCIRLIDRALFGIVRSLRTMREIKPLYGYIVLEHVRRILAFSFKPPVEWLPSEKIVVPEEEAPKGKALGPKKLRGRSTLSSHFLPIASFVSPVPVSGWKFPPSRMTHSMVIQIMRLVDAKPLCKAYMDRFSINDPNKE
jgi:hypothetical protein